MCFRVWGCILLGLGIGLLGSLLFSGCLGPAILGLGCLIAGLLVRC